MRILPEISVSLQWESKDSDEKINIQSLAALFPVLLKLSSANNAALVSPRSSWSLLLFRVFTVCLKVHEVHVLSSEMGRIQHVKTFQ